MDEAVIYPHLVFYPEPRRKWELTGLLGGDVNRCTGGAWPSCVVGSHCSKIESVGAQPFDILGGDVTVDLHPAHHRTSGVLCPVQNLLTTNKSVLLW